MGRRVDFQGSLCGETGVKFQGGVCGETGVEFQEDQFHVSRLTDEYSYAVSSRNV